MYLGALQVHVIVSYLEMYTDKVDEGDVVTELDVSDRFPLSMMIPTHRCSSWNRPS